MRQLGLDLSPRSAAVHRIAGRRVVASISGGADSAATSLYLTELGIEHERIHMLTGWEAVIDGREVTLEYIRGPLTEKLGPITEIRGELDFVQLVEKKGLFPSRVMRFCTTELKVIPAQRWFDLRRDARIDDSAPDFVNAVGIRRAESQARSRMAEWEWSDTFDLEVWRPIIAWSRDDVVAIHRRHGLEMNPLYGMGFKRVGCYPCIHENKAGIARVADLSPERIDLIDQLTKKLNERGAARDSALGRPFVPRSMFSYHGGDNRHVPLTIAETVAWARSGRGEWQPPAAGDGCMRWGMCETEDHPGKPRMAGPDEAARRDHAEIAEAG